MWILGYLAAILAVLLILQTLVLRAFKQPFQWTFGANSRQPKTVKWALKAVLQTTMVSAMVAYPFLIGVTPAAHFGGMLRADHAIQFLYGEGIALVLLAVIYGLGLSGGWLYWKLRFPPRKAFSKCAFSALSSITVVAIEEPIFRGVVLFSLLRDPLPWWAAIPLSAAIFSAVHFIRKVKTYWPAVGLACLGIWLGVAFYKTGNLWLSMGLHSGGILSIGVQRCFVNYKGPDWLVGTQTYPIAGLFAILIMLAGSGITWFLF